MAISILLACLALYLVVLAALTLGQRKLLYFPYSRVAAPAAVGLAKAQVLHLQTEDGETLLAWFVAPSPGRPLILYFHGNSNGLADTGERFRDLTETGDGLLAVEYRGYPGSTGFPSEQGLLRDAEATYAEALALGVPAGRIVAMGESLGSGVAVDLAARREVGALVLDSPYSSVVDVAAARLWMFPVRGLMSDTFQREDRQSLRACPHGAWNRRCDDPDSLWRKAVRASRRAQALHPRRRRGASRYGNGHPAGVAMDR